MAKKPKKDTGAGAAADAKARNEAGAGSRPPALADPSPAPGADFSTTQKPSPEAGSNAAADDADNAATAGGGGSTPPADAPRAQPEGPAEAAGSTPAASNTLPPTAAVVRTRRLPSRRRAGRAFGKHETVIPLAELTPGDLQAIDTDAELVAKLI